jgi:hypothetical protein
MADPNSILYMKEFFDRHNGLQRSNRFSVAFNGLPSGLPAITNEDFKVGNVAMATRAIDSIADNLAGYGSGRAVPRSQRFIPGVLMTFPVTNDSYIIEFFNAWFNRIYSGGRLRGNGSNIAAPYILEYYDNIVANCSMKIKLLNPNGGVNTVYTFYEVFPLENMPVEMSMEQQNKFLTYQVLFNFREFTLGDE